MKRTLFTSSAFIFTIRFFPVAATAAAGIFFSRLLPPALNGVYSRLWIVYTGVFTAIVCLGIVPFMLTHKAASVDQWLRKIRLRFILVSLLWLALLASVLVAIFRAQEIFEAWVAAPLLLVQVWILVSESYLIIHERFREALLASLSYALIFVGLHVAYLQGYCSLTGLFLLIAFLGLLRALCLTAVGLQEYRKAGPQGQRLPSELRHQWFQLGLYDVAQMLFRWLDKVVLSALIAPALFAVYLNGTLEVPFMATLLGAVGSGLLQHMAQGDQSQDARVNLLRATGSLLARIVFPLFFFLFFFREHFIVFVFSEKYLDSAPLFGISICTLLLRAYNFTSILQHLNQVKLINWGALLDLGLALVLALPLYFWLGLPGVVWAFMLSSYAQAAFYLYHTSRLLQRPVLSLIPWRSWAPILLLSGGIIGGLYFLLDAFCPPNLGLFLGFAGTALFILAALSPYLFKRKSHG